MYTHSSTQVIIVSKVNQKTSAISRTAVKCDDGKVLHDKPILVESYVGRTDLENEEKLRELLEFVKRLGKETNQAAVGLIINNVFHEITDYRVCCVANLE